MYYEELWRDLCAFIRQTNPLGTQELTGTIKAFFRGRYESTHHVFHSGDGSWECLVDVLVATFNPKDVVTARTLELKTTEVRALLAVESEIGGTGASSAYGVMKNVVEDFMKLLVIQATYRVMVFTSLPYKAEIGYVEARVELLRRIYAVGARAENGILLVHLHGEQPVSSQVRACFGDGHIRGFIIEPDGARAREIVL